MYQPATAVLLLEDGTIFYGRAIGATGTTVGELCFNTGMTGYQEVFTDPSYRGQIVVTTHTHIGTYGVQPDEAESDAVQIAGLVVRNFSDIYSRATATQSLQAYLAAHQRVGIADVDTRQLVRHIRAHGAMNAVLSSEILQPELLRQRLAAHPAMDGLELASEVSTPTPYDVNPEGRHRVAVLDFGLKRNILRSLTARGCALRVFPHNTPWAEMAAWAPHGLLLTNGPGDPAAMPQAVATVVEALAQEDLPIFGICMGNQILGRAAGIGTYKLRFGHRGLNHPVLHLPTGRAEITSQNHGFALREAETEAHPGVEITHRHLNDNTVAGIALKGRKTPAFAVQYHPESNPGPHDSRYLFDRFVDALR